MKNLFLSVAVILVGVTISAFVFVSAQNPFNFGGFVLASIPCTCSGNFLLTIGPPVGGQFVYYPGTQAFLHFNLPRPGVWAVGSYTPGGACLQFAGKICVPFGVPLGTITPQVGTSL